MESKILDKTYELIDEIKAKKEYQRLLELNEVIKKNDKIKELINDFNKAKIKYDEVIKYGKYHPDLKQTQINLKEKKETLYENDIMKEYKSLEKQIQKELDIISIKLSQTISKKIKHPNEIGLINKH